MAFHSDSTILFRPYASWYDVTNSSAVSGWKTIRFQSSEVQTGDLTMDTSNGRFTVGSSDAEGYYFVSFNHAHGNGGHGSYHLRIVSNGVGNMGQSHSNDGARNSMSTIMYMASGWYFECQTHHDNTSHNCEETDRMTRMAAFRLNNI